MKKRFTLTLVLLFLGASLFAQNSTQGKEFWLSFMRNGYQFNGGDWVETQVMVSAKRACSGKISNPRTSWSMTFEVANESVVVLQIPLNQGYNTDNEGIPSNFGLELTATNTVSVYTANCATNSFDATFVLPVESLGSDYIVQCDSQSKTQSTFADMETSAFLIVATEDNTQIDIIPSVATIDGHQAGNSYSVSLGKGQSYFMRSNLSSGSRDFSGTKISALDSKKIAVFNGNTLTTVPNALTDGFDHIFEQALPVETWGQQFAVTGSANRTRDLVKVTAGHDNDTVWCNGQFVAVLDAGQSHTFWLYSGSESHQFGGGSCFVETSLPSMLYLYNTTCYDSEGGVSMEDGDPSMVWIPPVEQKINEITFCTFNHYQAPIDYHYVNIVVETASVNEVYLDGNLINPSQFETLIGNEAYSFAKVVISHGVHHLSCMWGLIGHVYGFGLVKGYAYCVGANVLDLSGSLFVNGQSSNLYHNGLYLCVGESADFMLRTNYPVNRVFWDFDGAMTEGGMTATHVFNQVGDFVTKAFVEGIDAFTNEPVYDTLTFEVHVGEPEYHVSDTMVCDVDAFDYYGVLYSQSGHFERVGTSIYGCDSTYILTIDMEFTPQFEFVGTHWPVGGSETHISVNEYGIRTLEPRAHVDTVLWQIDCPNWYVEPHGKGETCTLYIFTYLLEPVTLHAWAVNRCDTVHEEFFIQTSYYGTDELDEEQGFAIYPNPSEGRLMMHFGDMRGTADIEVYNSIGQKVEMFSLDLDSCNELDYTMYNHDNGLYVFVLKNNGRIFTRKVTLTR